MWNAYLKYIGRLRKTEIVTELFIKKGIQNGGIQLTLDEKMSKST